MNSTPTPIAASVAPATAPLPPAPASAVPPVVAPPFVAPSALRIGHVHLKVANLDRALGFWRDILGLQVMARMAQAVFLSAGGYHHHIALNTWDSLDGPPPAPGTTGLFHVALLYPDRVTLATVLRRLLASGVPLDGASDHGVSEALYLRDPDGNGVELYRDRPEADWPRDVAGVLQMHSLRLDVAALLAEAP